MLRVTKARRESLRKISGCALSVVLTVMGSMAFQKYARAQATVSSQNELTFSGAKNIVRQAMAEYSPVIESGRTTVRFANENCEILYDKTEFILTRSSFGMHKASVLAKGTRCPSHNWYQVLLCLENQVDRCEQLHRAFIYLQQRAKRLSGGDVLTDADFAKVVTDFKRSDPRPVFPEEARRFRVQAERAVQDKEFEDASDRYAEAFKFAPWWPEGRFNRALILGELKEYAEAMVEMKRYLMLVPDAPNARAAQDKIYEWEGKVKL